MEERRKHTRKYLVFFTRVFERYSGRLLGYLADVSAGGAMLISDEPLETNRIFHLRMDLSEDFSKKGYLEFDAKSVWCKPDITPIFYNTGLQLLDMSPEDLNILQRISEEYSFRD